MKKRCAILLALCLILPTLTGCSLSRQPEHQAYAISMALDVADDGNILLAVQVPSIGAPKLPGSEATSSTSTTSDYAFYAASGGTYSEALDLLQNTIPRTLKLAQLRSLVFGERLARSPAFGQVVDQIIMSYYTYGSAVVVICLGDALDFLEKQQPSIGSSLSAKFEHYLQTGYIPLMTLYGLYAANHSIYADPVIAVAANAPIDTLAGSDAIGETMGDTIAGKIPRKSNTENQYMGAALIRDGQVVEVLNGRQYRILQMLSSNLRSLAYIVKDSSAQIEVVRGPSFHVALRPDSAEISLDMAIDCKPLLEAPDLKLLAQTLEADIREVISLCQAAGVEPLSLGEMAARHFATIDDYERYNLREKFAASDVGVTIDVKLKRE